MTTACLIQCASGPDLELLRLSYPIHSDFCRRHGFQYRASFLKSEPSGRSPIWSYIPALRDELERLQDGALVVKLDADALIIGDEDLRGALPDGADIGMVERQYMSNSVLNSGVIFVRNSEKVREIWRAIWDGYQGEEDNVAVNERLLDIRSGLAIAKLDGRYNFCGAASPPTYPIQIRAWHGESKEAKFAGMKAATGEQENGR